MDLYAEDILKLLNTEDHYMQRLLKALLQAENHRIENFSKDRIILKSTSRSKGLLQALKHFRKLH